jgi:hypothetical protein
VSPRIFSDDASSHPPDPDADAQYCTDVAMDVLKREDADMVVVVLINAKGGSGSGVVQRTNRGAAPDAHALGLVGKLIVGLGNGIIETAADPAKMQSRVVLEGVVRRDGTDGEGHA